MASPAAVLSILVNANTAQATAALGKTHGQLVATEKQTGKTRTAFAKFGKVAAVGIAGGAVAAGVALKGFVNAAMDSEKSNARMRAQLKASGIEFDKHAGQINKVIEKQSKLSALDDEDLQDSFTNIVRITGDVNEALKLNGLAADFARAKNIDVAKAGELVGKVAGGNTGILARYGIKVKEGATAQEALAMMQGKFAGQAKAYGETAAGAQDRFKVAVENLQEALGARLLPIVAKVMNAVTGFVNSLSAGSGAAGGFGRIVGSVFEFVKGAVGTAIEFLRGQFDAHRDDFAKVGEALKNIGIFYREVWEHVALPIIKRVLPAIVTIIRGAFNVIGGLVKFISNVLTGDFRGAWDAVKQIFRGALQIIGGLIRAATAPFREAAARIGEAIGDAFSAAWGKVKDGVRAVLDWIRDRFEDFKNVAERLTKPFVAAFDKIAGAVKKVLDFFGDIVDKVKSVIDFIGKIKLPSINIPFLGGGKGGRPVPGGALPSHVSGFEDDARAFGLVVTSGFRPGDPGWHGLNRARDFSNSSGPTPQMMAFAQYMAANFGLKLKELIYTPLGFSIDNGVRTAPFAQKDHYDHVHVALANGGYLRKGGWAVVGERGPELAHLPSGSNVYSNSDSRAMLGGGDVVGELRALRAEVARGEGLTRAMVERALYDVISGPFSRGWQGRTATPGNASSGVRY